MQDLAEQVASRFKRTETRRRLQAYLRGLLAGPLRKNGAALAEFNGEHNPYGMQRLLRTAEWDADAVRDDIRSFFFPRLSGRDAVTVIAEATFTKRGSSSAGVARQYSRRLGRIDNCQAGIFLGCASAAGAGLLDRELYLPRTWADDRDRCETVGIGPEITYATKPELTRRMLDRLLGEAADIGWVATGAADCVNDGTQYWLLRRGLPYVLAARFGDVPAADDDIRSAASMVKSLEQGVWRHVEARGEEQWAAVPLPRLGTWPRWLLARRTLGRPRHLSTYVCSAPPNVPWHRAVAVVRDQQRMDAYLDDARIIAGLDRYQSRSFTGWYRHVTLAMLAYNLLTVPESRRSTSGHNTQDTVDRDALVGASMASLQLGHAFASFR